MMSRAVDTRHVRSDAIALLAVGALLATSCSSSNEVIFDNPAPELSVTTSPPETTTTMATRVETTTESTTVITRAPAGTTAPTRSTLALSEDQIDGLTAKVVVGGSQDESMTIIGPGDDRLELSDSVAGGAHQPTWSPDGQFVAWASDTDDGYSVAISPTSGGRTTTYETPFGVFYMQWRPDSRAIGLLGASEPGMVGLAILSLDDGTVTSMNSSLSYYFHWSPEGDELITHLDGTRLELLDPSTGDAFLFQALNPVNSAFQAAAWTPDGRSVLYVRPAPPDSEVAQDALVIHNLDTGEIDVLGQGTGLFNFAVSPDSKSVAYSIQNIGAATSMRVVDLATGRSQNIDAPRTFAWQWSPDSHKILLLGVGADAMTVSVYESGNIAYYQNVTPTRTFLQQYLAFWGQYDLSHSLWAPDSSSFVFPAFDRGMELVFLQLLDDELPILLGPGSMAVFAPANDTP